MTRVVLLAFAVCVLALPAAAVADPPVCPDPPAGAYDGTDDAASEVHVLRGELAAACAVAHADADRAHADSGDLAAKLATLHDDLVAVHDALVATDGPTQSVAVTNWPTAGTQGDPTVVSLASSDPLPADVEQNAATIHGDLWAILGFGSGAIFGVLLLRRLLL